MSDSPQYLMVGGDGRQYGPVTAAQLQQWIQDGRAVASTQVQVAGSNAWRPLSEFPEFSDPLERKQSAPPTPAPASRKNNPMALAGMIMGIISVSVGLCCCYGFPFNVLGIIFSVIGLSQVKKSNGTQDGRGMAIAGLVCSIVSLVLALFMLIFVGVMSAGDFIKEVERISPR